MTFSFNPGPPAEAYKFWQDKVPMGRSAFNNLAEDERVKAFVVSGMAKGDMLTAMHRSIGDAMKNGQSMTAWKKDVNLLFDANGWSKLDGFRLDTIFRTNMQTAYSVGRHTQMMDTVESRPYWRYSAINDSRTRPSHSALHGRVVRADDPFWDTFMPPNGFRCRCTVTSLSERDLNRLREKYPDNRGLDAAPIKPGDMLEPLDNQGKPAGLPVYAMPDKHFDSNPGKDYWKADTTRFRADVKQMVLKDIIRACPEDFCGACEFAETDCFKRLKRHLTQVDLEDLQTIVWAEGERVKKGFGEWVDQVLESRQTKGELYPVGNLPGVVLASLKKQPRLALVTMDDSQLNHLSRGQKAGRDATLTENEIKAIPDRLTKGRWWFDKEKKNYLVTWERKDSVWLKVAINMDYKIGNSKKRIANHIMTSGVVQSNNIQGNKRYEEI